MISKLKCKILGHIKGEVFFQKTSTITRKVYDASNCMRCNELIFHLVPGARMEYVLEREKEE